MTTRPGRRTT
ncbi:hypothetical protein CIB84_014526 [Bambusicola thoracicus]|uniref:Uncharacterized protein n=1 Tax=Bambusicola thoracicus TaxID=9083 RepID=A0A2P4SC98_BAMTH|nr:hypothetical protein CIB84_014526 [Bambusicola thoracicus]